MPETPQIVLAIPGFWSDRTELVQAIAGESGGYIFGGSILLNTTTHQHWELNLYDRDPRFLRTLAITGQGSITNDDLRSIAEHNMVCALSGDGGSTLLAKQIMDAAAALLRADGAAVYVESAGKSISSSDWTGLSESESPTALYEGFVAIINGDTSLYSCGMHTLGLPDASVETETVTEEEARLLRAFNLYRLIESPELETGHTFSLTPESTFYRIALLPCTEYEEENLFYNPYGIWRLTPI